MTGLPVPVVVEEGRPADDEAVATAVAPPAGEATTLGERELGARGMARGRGSMMFVRSSEGLFLWGIPMVLEGIAIEGEKDVAMKAAV